MAVISGEEFITERKEKPLENQGFLPGRVCISGGGGGCGRAMGDRADITGDGAAFSRTRALPRSLWRARLRKMHNFSRLRKNPSPASNSCGRKNRPSFQRSCRNSSRIFPKPRRRYLLQVSLIISKYRLQPREPLPHRKSRLHPLLDCHPINPLLLRPERRLRARAPAAAGIDACFGIEHGGIMRQSTARCKPRCPGEQGYLVLKIQPRMNANFHE